MRSVPEWIGSSDDQAIPARVKVRVFDAFGGRCAVCTQQIAGKLRPAYDHDKAIINGGENRESNLQLLCVPCHAVKTKTDVAEKSVTYRKRAKQIGIKKPRTMTRWRKFDGTIVHAARSRRRYQPSAQQGIGPNGPYSHTSSK